MGQRATVTPDGAASAGLANTAQPPGAPLALRLLEALRGRCPEVVEAERGPGCLRVPAALLDRHRAQRLRQAGKKMLAAKPCVIGGFNWLGTR